MHLPDKEQHKELAGHDSGNILNLPTGKRTKALEEQNDNLRAVIRQMRHDMEDLSGQLATQPPSVIVHSRNGEEGTSVPLTKGT